jgi:hypothetical protein
MLNKLISNILDKSFNYENLKAKLNILNNFFDI